MKRRIDWPERLAEIIDARRHVPFEWGAHDCCLFCADVILRMTDIDPAKDLRGYTTEREALELIEDEGGIENFVARAGLDNVHSGLAQRGDVVLVELDGRATFGIVAGNGFWCAPGKDGLVFRPMSEVKKAFRV